PETNLVMVRRKGPSGFSDVTLDCAGTIAGWSPLGSAGEYEYARFDLMRHNFEPQGSCGNGARKATSADPFGLWIWGSGSWEASDPGKSYGYPAGEAVQRVNSVVVAASTP